MFRPRAAICLLPLLATLACAAWLPAPVPLRTVSDVLPNGKARCLVVFLPGRGDSAEDFAREGFLQAFRERQLSVDVVATDATLGYYAKNTLVDRLATDVFARWLPRGYEQVWAIGNSMGGLGTFLYALKGPTPLNGLFALAPYLGDRDLVKEIKAQGGLASWNAPPKAAVLNEDNYQAQLWRWLQAVTKGTEPGPDLYVAVGADDGLAKAVDVLAPSLPAGHTWKAPGGHDWPIWRELLKPFLDNSDFSRACGPKP